MDPRPLPDDFLEILENLARIGAPTGEESRRADFLLGLLGQWGAGSRARRDSIHNVWLDLADGAGNCRLIDAHTDIVFDDDSPPLRKDGNRWYAPGIGDDTVACVQLLCMARELLASGSPQPVIVSFTVGEEGLGDLCGIKATVAEFRPRLRDAILLESGVGTISCDAVGSVRYRITLRGPGGHSWGKFGTASAIHEASRMLMRFEQWMPWRNKELSFNAGLIRGGTTVNSVAEEAQLVMDFRAVDPACLDQIRNGLPGLLRDLESGAEGIRATAEKIGDRPAGSLAHDHPLILEILEAHTRLGIEPRFNAGSTNANATLAAGIPSARISVGESGGCHTREEFVRIDTLDLGWNLLNQLTPRATP